MKIIFYKTLSDADKVEKELEPLGESAIVTLRETDVVSPVLVLANIPDGANYCYIDAFKRFYFVESVEVKINNLFTVSLSCDVLHTYRDEIRASRVEIIEADEPLNLNKADYDGEYIETVIETDFENPFNGATSDILVTAQGEQ